MNIMKKSALLVAGLLAIQCRKADNPVDPDPGPSPSLLPAVDSLWTADAVDRSDLSYRLVWNRVEGAEGYEVHSRSSPDSPFASIATVRADTSTLLPIEPIAGPGELWFQIRILPFSVSGRGGKDEARILTVEDRVPPVFRGSFPAAISPSFDNRDQSQPLEVTLDFTLTSKRDGKDVDEALDTTVTPTFLARPLDCFEPPDPLPEPEFRWTSLSGGRITYTIPAGGHALGFRFYVETASLRDLGGNQAVGDETLLLASTACPSPWPEAPHPIDSIWLSARVPVLGWWDRSYPYEPPPVQAGLSSETRPFPSESNTVWRDTDIVDYSTERYTLHWTRVANATFYEIYQRRDAADAWKKIGMTGPETTYTVVCDPGADPKPIRRQHKIVPGNRGGSSPLADAPTLEVRDGISPSMFGIEDWSTHVGEYDNPNGAVFLPLFDSGFDNRNKDSDYVATLFMDFEHISSIVPMEPLDTSVVPMVEIKESPGKNRFGETWDDHYKPEFISFTWISATEAAIKVRVAAGKNGMYDRLTVSLDRVTDLSGNPLLGHPEERFPAGQTPLRELTFRLGRLYQYDP
jgi:hypothetical protein